MYDYLLIILTCMQFSRYNLFILTDILSVIRNLKPCLKSLITGKTSYHNSTSLLIGLTPAHRSSPSTVLFPTELTCQRLFLYEQAPSLFFSLIRRPPALPHRLQCSTIGRLRLNRRVRDGNGCFPQAHRHRKLYLLGEVLSSLVNKLVLRGRTTSLSLITQQ